MFMEMSRRNGISARRAGQSRSAALGQLSANPSNIRVKRLNPGTTSFSMRVGNYRILFDLVEDYHLIAVQSIERRTSTTY